MDLEQTIKLGVVNYLNAKPLLRGMQSFPFPVPVEIVADTPARLADMLLSGELDLGLVPVAVLKQIPNGKVVGNYCIGTEGEVASVCLFSEKPISEVKKVFLDYQSRTSVELLQWIMREYWNIFPEIEVATNEDFRNEIKGSTAGLVIGDRAFEQRLVSTFIYDLGSEWKKITGLPFVFAAWISNKELPASFVEALDASNEVGLNDFDSIISENPYPLFDLGKYFRFHISYTLDENKRKGLARFLELLNDS